VLAMTDNQPWGLLAAFAVLMIAYGLCSLFLPRTAWFFSEGWKFKGAEPSGCALAAIRIGGLVGIILGTVLLFIARTLMARAH
jgi:hypothetical protein